MTERKLAKLIIFKLIEYENDAWVKTEEGFKGTHDLEEAIDLIIPYLKPNWISVHDKLPKESQEVLVCNINGIDQDERDPFIAVLNCKKFFWINRYNFDDWKEEIVTHWMPLPEGPEKELEE
jgi:hypothetical protein